MSEIFDGQGLFSVKAAANWMGGLAVRTLRKHIRDGRLHTVKIGKRRLVPKQELERIQREGLDGPKEIQRSS